MFTISATRARESLKRRVSSLRSLRHPLVGIVGFHGFRRGRARDEYQAGTAVSRILELGGWKSASVLRYLAIKEIDEVTTLNVTVDASDSDA